MRINEKGSFSKLYLIEMDKYQKCLSVLSRLERDETQSLNEKHSTSDELDTNQSDVYVNDQNDDNIPDTTLSEGKQIQSKEFSKATPIMSSKSADSKQMKPKKFACNVCINKKFTTKHSLKRHHKTFHEVHEENKQGLKKEERPTSNAAELEINPSPEKAYVSDSLEAKNSFPRKRKIDLDSEDFGEEATPEKVVKFSRGTKRGASGLESKKKKFRWENF
jgi:hypothetical protein